MGKTRVLLADDHRLMLEAVRFALEDDGGFEIVGATSDATKVLGLVAELAPEVVLLDVRMPLLDGITCLKRIHGGFPDIVVVMLSAVEDAATVREAMASGASAFVLKHLDPAALAGVIRRAVAGDIYESPGVFAEAASELAAEAGLTVKEHEILNLLSTGLSNAEIARELVVADQTVKFHLSNVYRKLRVHGRTAAVEVARRRGLIANPLLRDA